MGPDDGFCGSCGAAAAGNGALVLDQRPSVAVDHASSALADWAPSAPLDVTRGSGIAETADPCQVPGRAFRQLPLSTVRCGIDEVLWRRYHVLQMGGLARCSGYLYVTDSRVVFFAYSSGFFLQRASTLVRETKVEDITGINAYVTRRFSFALLWLSLITGAAGIGLVFTLVGIPLALLLWCFSAACFIALLTGRGRIGSTIINIHSRNNVSPVNIGGAESVAGSLRTLLGAIFTPWHLIFGGTTAAHLDIYGLPGSDANAAVVELGALIQDLQTRGETAAQHWQVLLPGRSPEHGVALQ